jgi:iron complex outermembrane receptor protein
MKTKSEFQKKSLVVAVATATVLAASTSTVFGAEGAMLEEVLVTATRRSQSVQDIPFNISAVSGDSLDKAGIVDSVDLIRSVAGISVIDRGYRNSGMTNGIVIRGINVDSGANGDVPLAAVPTVATYVGDTALYGNFILKDIDRVEVLRGPQGTLYGSGSLAGTVRYIMNKPNTEEFSGKIGASYGVTDGSDGNNISADLMLNIPISDTFAIRANIGKIDNDGIVDYTNVYATDGTGDPVVNGNVATATPEYTTVKDADDVDIEYVRVSALFEPSDTFSAQLSYQRQEDEIGGRRQVTRGDDLVNGGQYGDYENGAVMLEPSEREVELMALEIEVDLGFATLTSATSDYSHDGVGISDNTGVYAQNGWLGFYYSSPRPFAQAERFYDDSAFAQELRLVSNGENFIDWTVGLYYTDQDSLLGQNSYLKGYEEYVTAVSSFAFITEQDFKFRRNQSYKEMAVFGEATINLSDDLRLTLGGRYFDNELDVDAFVEIPYYGGAPGEAKQSITEDDVLFKANIAFDVSDDGMFYGTISEGYRHGGANAVPTSGTYAESPEYFTFDSDSVINYEVGYKGSTDSMTYTASLYYTDWSDPQLNTATNNWGFFGVINGESARTQGLELEVAGQLSESISYAAGYTYADAELTDDVYKPAGNFYGNLVSSPLRRDLVAEDGDRLPGTSEHVFNVSLVHQMALSNSLTLRTQLSGYYQSDSLNSLGSDDPTDALYVNTAADIDSFQLWNIVSSLSNEDWTASLYVKNIANEEGVTGVVTPEHMGSAPDATNRYFANASNDSISLPRTMGVSFAYNF